MEARERGAGFHEAKAAGLANEEATSQGRQMASRKQKRREMSSPLEFPKGTVPRTP